MYDSKNITNVIPAIQIAAYGLKNAIIIIIITRIKNHLRPILLKKTIYFFGIIFQYTAISYDILIIDHIKELFLIKI